MRESRALGRKRKRGSRQEEERFSSRKNDAPGLLDGIGGTANPESSPEGEATSQENAWTDSGGGRAGGAKS